VSLYVCGQRTRNLGVCQNAVMLPEPLLDRAGLVELGKALTPAVIDQALNLALKEPQAEEQARAAPRRIALERALAAVAVRIDRLTEAVASGAGALPALLEKLTREETRRTELTRERDALDVTSQATALFSPKLRKAIRAAAGTVRTALLEDPRGRGRSSRRSFRESTAHRSARDTAAVTTSRSRRLRGAAESG